jgi:carbamoyltransferase
MITWGISANSHDAALAVFETKQKGLGPNQSLELKFASHSERFSGIKNDADLNRELVSYARQWGDPDEIVWYEQPFKKTLRQFWAGQGWKYLENDIAIYLARYEIIETLIKYVSHHHSHAAAGYYTSSFTDATVVCLDSIGEFETLTIWAARDKKLKKIFSQGYPHSIGLWYSAMTQRIGLKPNEDEYILMGMAAYGDPKRLFMDILNDFIDKEGIGFNPKTKIKHNLHRGCQWWRPDLTSEQDLYDIAAATQKVYEYVLENILIWARKNSPSRNVVLMGGCALNCSANSIAYKYFDNVWIMPNPGDAGSAIGAVLAHKKQHIKFNSAYLGYDIKGEYPIEALINELKTTGIAGVANGKAEFGPRAFGNRSLLADPRGSDIKDRVNDIKQRQRFRPFAPAILEEFAADYFDGSTGPYMQFTARCKFPELYPAIVHADGTSRVQTVSREDSTGFRKLLEAWYAATGCPMLLNTSLNIKGKPMVNDLTDAREFAKMYNIKVFS